MATIGRVEASEGVVRAHAQLMADPTIQFHFSPIAGQASPAWLIAVFKFLEQNAALLKLISWIILGLVAVLVVAMIGLAAWRYFRTPRSSRSTPHILLEAGQSLQPSAPRVRALLEEADRLAAENRFDDATHVLLWRTIADLHARRPRAVRPALTSRDIADLEALPPLARSAFALIALRVERSFFGGQSLDRADFAACRQAYAAFANPESWASGAKF